MFIFVVKLIQKLLKKESQSDGWTKWLTFVHFVLKKLMVLFTFALYIRIILKTNQFILTSWISEIYHFNYDGSKRKASIVIAFLTLIAWIILIIATIVLAVSKSAFSNSESPEKKKQICTVIQRSVSKQEVAIVYSIAPTSKSNFRDSADYRWTSIFNTCNQPFGWIGGRVSRTVDLYKAIWASEMQHYRDNQRNVLFDHASNSSEIQHCCWMGRIAYYCLQKLIKNIHY